MATNLFGEYVRELRQATGMTQQQLGSAMGYASHTVPRDIESGRRKGTVHLASAVATALMCRVHEERELHRRAAIDQGYDI